MKKELIEAWAKYLENNYSVGPVDYEAMKSMEYGPLITTLRDLAREACKKKIHLEYTNFLKKTAKTAYKDMLGEMAEIKFKTDAATDLLKINFNPLISLCVEDLLALIKHSNILEELYDGFEAWNYKSLMEAANNSKLNNAKFVSSISIRTTSVMSEEIRVSTEHSFKNSQEALINSVSEHLTDNKEAYDVIVSTYYTDPITEECVFYSCNHYNFEFNTKNNKWLYSNI